MFEDLNNYYNIYTWVFLYFFDIAFYNSVSLFLSTTSATAGQLLQPPVLGQVPGGARDPRNPKTTGRLGGPRSRPKVQPAPPDVWKVSRHDRGAELRILARVFAASQ